MDYLQRAFKLTIWDYVLQWWSALTGLFWTVNVNVFRGTNVPLHHRPARSRPDLTDTTDQELVELCLKVGAKDDRPFKELFHRHQTTVWRVCYSFVRNADDAEDLMQDVFFKVYRSLHQFEGRSSLKTWLYRIAMNVSQNEIRRRSRRPQESGTPVEVLSESLSIGETPEAQVMASARYEQLGQALATLRPEAARALKLKDLEQRPYHEIAQMLEISESAAKMRVQRARLALMAAYRELEQAQGELYEPVR